MLGGLVEEIKDIRVHMENKKKLDSLPIKGSSMMILETGSGKRPKK